MHNISMQDKVKVSLHGVSNNKSNIIICNIFLKYNEIIGQARTIDPEHCFSGFKNKTNKIKGPTNIRRNCIRGKTRSKQLPFLTQSR